MSQQVNNLIANIDEITTTIIAIGEKINGLSVLKPPSLTFSEANGNGMFKLMTDRQIAKKIIMLGGSQTGSAGGVPVDPKIAHLMVYGKFMYGAGGQLVDNEILFPDCVAPDGQGVSGITHMSASFPLLQYGKKMKDEFITAMAGLRIKVGEIAQAFIDMVFQLILAITTLASAVTILPPGSGLPTALSAVKSIPTTFMAFQTRIVQIIPFLKPLTYIEVLIPADKIDSVLIPVNLILNLIKRPFQGVDIILGLVGAAAASTPPVPGVDGTPAEAIELSPSADPKEIPFAQAGITDVKLKANASKGSWQFDYQWSSEPSGFIGSEKEMIARPLVTTKYIVNVTDKKDNSLTKSGEIIVTVIQPQ